MGETENETQENKVFDCCEEPPKSPSQAGIATRNFGYKTGDVQTDGSSTGDCEDMDALDKNVARTRVKRQS